MSLRDFDAPPTLTAALGPTNTGKTYRAIRRMLGHRSGVIGVPLRLLAREVYDTLVGEVGVESVALVTGEERIEPARARYRVYTTESMPPHARADFVALDEVQLATHRERGHAFTERLLHARGYRETWLLGSDTMVPIVQDLLPTADIQTYPRMSALTWAGSTKLGSLPPRTAVVAFSAAHVYELAERIRVRRGGAAVVMGALSPRTRNAQVAMYQSGEVEFLVATDAIGMGLNMDIDHVAFAATSKFDGREHRPLSPAELAQIAGRAGRHTRDGSFGTLRDVAPLSADVVAAIEAHTFAPVRRIQWRNPDLEMGSVGALLDSLGAPPPRPMLLPVRDAADHDALRRLARRPEVRARVDGPATVALLWEVCRVPDFRHSLEDSHVNLLADLFMQLTSERAALSSTWVDERVGRLDRVDGDIDGLMARIAFTRTWTYIAHRNDWVDDAPALQARTRDIEDRLSDALHDKLTQRFVDHRAVALITHQRAGWSLEATVDDAGDVTAAGHALGRLAGFDFEVTSAGGSQSDPRAALKAARRLLAAPVADRLRQLLEAPDDAFAFDEAGGLAWDGVPLGQLAGADELLRPQLRMFRHDLLDSGARGQVHQRAMSFVAGWVERLLAPLWRVEARRLRPPARAIQYELERRMGLVSKTAVAQHIPHLSPMDRRSLARMDVRLGTRVVYVESMLKPQQVRARALLWSAYRRYDPFASPPPHGVVSVPVERDGRFYWHVGYVPIGPRAIRADQLERLLHRLRQAAKAGPFVLPAAMPSWLGCSRGELYQVVEKLGYPRGEDEHFMPMPPKRRRRGRPRTRRRS